MEFTDFQGRLFSFSEIAWNHIRESHPEIETPEAITEVLADPDMTIRSGWDPGSVLYYKKRGKLWRVVVVQETERRVKTAYTTDRVKAGEVVWERKA